MSAAFVFTIIALCFHRYLHSSSVSASSPGQESSPWFIGCVNATSSLRLHAPKGARDLDPGTCCVRCLHEGYQFAALSSETCYCGDQLHGLVVSECFHTSSNKETKDVKGGGERRRALCLPLGNGQEGNVALYRSEGPFLLSISVSASPDRVLAGKTFVLEVSGNLAGNPGQPTGILGLGGQDLSYVTVEFLGTTSKGQSSRHVNVLDDGSFTLSSDWILKTPGKYEITVHVSNSLSTLSSTLHLSVLQSSQSSLEISLLHGPLGVPSCIPFVHSDSDGVTVEAAYQGDPVTLLACVSGGLTAKFHWWFTHNEEEKNTEGVETACLSNSGCLNSTVNWTFEAEGVHTVSVNASSVCGWTQETIHVAVVSPVVSDLRVSVPGNQLAAGEDVSVDVEFFTTMKQLLVLKLSLNAEYDRSYEEDLSGVEKDCNHSNITYDYNVSLHHSNACRHDGILLHPHLPLLHTSDHSRCLLHLHLQCRLPTSAGQYRLVASILAANDRSSVLLSTVLPQTLMVFERICALRPSGSWTSVASTHKQFSLEVVCHARHTRSRVVWTISLNKAVVMNRTTEEWLINVSLPKAGRYAVTVKAFNPVSWASFQSQILVQDPVGGLVLSIPSQVTTNQKHLVVFNVTVGTDVTVSMLMNGTLLYRNSSYTAGEEASVILVFNRTGRVAINLRAENRVSSQNRCVTVCVEGNNKPSPQATWQAPSSQSAVRSVGDKDQEVKNISVRIYAAKQAYPTNAAIIFLAVADVPDPVEFLWHFGDSESATTTSRTITKRYHNAGSYDVVVVVSRGQSSVTSDVFALVVQRAVKLNRLVHLASVLQNQTVIVSCRVNAGTDLTFLWSFGDGTTRRGQSTEQHVFHRTGEFRVEVTVSNLVSSASLSSYIFVVDRPCRPPPVKNMGPLKLQVRRYEIIRLGVTYETEVGCDVSGGLHYAWTLFDSAGRTFPLPLADSHRQSLILQSHLLQHDTYTAIARVQVIGSVVYSNYSVRVQVMLSPPVAVIQGGTNVFINRSTTTVTLDGQASYDPDFPTNPLSYSWTCKPVSSITSSCFNQLIPTSSPVLKFPVSFLKHNFDQFQFTLTVHSGDRSASSETFLTVKSNLIGKVSVYCPECRGDHVNWDQSFSVSAICEDCNIPPKHIQYTWSLHLVDASSRPVIEVPFCYPVDLRAPSAIMEDPATSLQTPEISTVHPAATNASEYTHTVYASAPSPLTVDATETKAKNQHLDLAVSGASLNSSKNASNNTGLSESEPSTSPRGLDNSSSPYSDHFSQNDMINEFPNDPDSSADWEFSFPVLEGGDVGGQLGGSVTDLDYEIPFRSPEEGDPGMSAGRPTGVDGEGFSTGDVPVFDPALHNNEGSNLVDSKPSMLIREPGLLDLPREAVDRDVFESFTYTGISSPLLMFRPFSLRPRSRYMLEVTAKSQNSFLGRTQLFLETNPVPKGMTCQVQPVKGTELHTHFSVFCTSGREDLLYEYSFSVGGRPRRILHQGRDFQYYFSLPSGDPSDDYKVTIYTEVRSSTYESATKPCPVTVQVQPSFFRETSSSSSSHHDPDVELSESGLRNLSALVQLGNSVEIRNHISLLSSILNRLSLDTEANTHAQRRMRSVLICTVCELESSEQVSVADNISILKVLLQVTSQVTLVSARRVTAYVQSVSEQFCFSEFGAPDCCHANQGMLNTLVSLLSYSLQAVTSCDLTPKTSNSANITGALESTSSTGKDIENDKDTPSGCLPECCTGLHIKEGRSVSTKQMVRLVDDILQTASDLMLKYILFHKTQEQRVNTGLITLYAACQNRTSTVISSGSTTFYVPASLIQILFGRHSGRTEQKQHQPCVLSVLTELAHSPYTWYPAQLSGRVVDLSLYKCRTRRKIPIRALIQPISIELQHPQKNSTVRESILLRSHVNYHSFSITQEHLQQAIQLTVVFTPPPNKAFPIMLLFRMFERPTPSMHHLHRIHRWESNTTRITLLPSYLNAAGIGHLALLNADFGKAPRSQHLSEQISYSLTVDSSLCLSWDDQLGAWTRYGCRTQQADTTPAVNCSCHQLRPLTVVQQQIHSSHDTTNLDPFLSASCDVTVLGVLMVCVCLYIPGLVVCQRADVLSEENQRVHFLSDNSPFDPYLYGVTIHTGLCSAACMSAKVYIELYGENGFSQTKELQVPGCSLFRRNSKDTFVLSAADSLGPVWGVHIWHDNSGPSPDWYLKQVEVSEVSRGGVKGWLFVGQCWLAVNKGDGRVERMLRVCTQGLGFAKMLSLKLSDYLADFHIWMSVSSCPCPSSFTHTQRLGVCLLLLLGYACVNTVIISQTDNQLSFEVGFIDVSAVSVTTGLLSVVAVLPAATALSFLFRLRGVKLMGSGVQNAKGRITKKVYFEGDALSVNDSIFEPHLSWNGLQQWAQEAWWKKYQDTHLLSVSTTILQNKEIQPDVVISKEDVLKSRGSEGAALQKLLLISEGSSTAQATQIKEIELLTESSRFHRTQKAGLTVTRNEGQRDKASQGKCSSDCRFEDGSHDQTACGERRLRPTSQWCHYVAWALCLLLSLSCLVLSAVLGMRFSSSKVLLWIHSLFFSLISCIFLIQPAVILAVAVTVSCWYRKRPDFHSFCSISEFEMETSKLWSHYGADQLEEQFRPCAFSQKRSSHLEKLLRARQRARHLRLVRPPTPAELRKTRRKKRKETFIHEILRDLSLCAFMLFLLTCITYSSSLSDHYHLNEAVRQQFIRKYGNAFLSIQKHEDWWKWTQTSLLDSLYKNASAASHVMIGEPVLQKMDMPSQSQVSMVTLLRTCGHLSCYSGQSATVGLGRTKSDAASKLQLLRSGGWMGGQTVALKVHFTLYSPAPNLFTSVTLLTEQSPTGVLQPSAKVQSVRVYHTPAVWDYVVMVCQLLFLVLSLLQLCKQVSNVGQQGLMGYWRTPCNWVEVSLLTVTLVYYACYIYHSTIISDVVELLQRHNHRGHVDVSLVATWEQFIRILRGVMLFLVTMKCVTVLKMNRTLAVFATLFAHSLSSLLWPAISGVILLVAFSCMENLLYVQSSWTFSSLGTLLCHYRGIGAAKGLLLCGRDVFYCGVLYLSSTVVWAAVVIGVMSSLIRSAKRSQRKWNVFTTAELAGYIRRRVTGQRRQAWIDNSVEGRTCYLEEFESLVDELLFRLNALSDSLYSTLPPKAHRCREEDSPVVSPTPEYPNMDTQDSVTSQIMVNDPVDVGDHCASNHGEPPPASHLLRPQVELEILQQKGQMRDNPSSVASEDKIKSKNCMSYPESASLKRLWTEGVLQRQADLWTKANSSALLSKTQTTHTEVVVEVLVHAEPGRVEPDTQ